MISSTVPLVRGTGGTLLPLVIVGLLGLGLRTSVSALAPVYSLLVSDLSLSPADFALLGTLPPICFALCGFIAPRVIERFGVEPTLAVAALGTSIATLGRALAPDTAWLLAASAIAFLFVGIENVALPPLLKTYFSHRIGAVTAAYTALVAAGSALPPLVAPLFIANDEWRGSLILWAAIAFASTVPCLLLARLTKGRRTTIRVGADAPAPDPLVPAPRTAETPGGLRVYRSSVAWSVAIALSVASIMGYFLFAWMPTLLEDVSGVDAQTASLLLALFASIAFPVYALGPIITARTRRPWILYLASGGMFLAGLLGLLVAPTPGLLLWVILLGLGQMLYAIAMTLVNVRTETVRGATALSGFMQAIAYGAGGLGMWGLSAIYIATSDWSAVLIILAALSALGALAGFALGDRTVEVDLGVSTSGDHRAEMPRADHNEPWGGQTIASGDETPS